MTSLGSLGLHHFLSQSALEHVLKEISKTGLPTSISRRTIKRARDKEVNISTPYGSLIVKRRVTLEPGKDKTLPKQVDLPFVNPLALLYHIAESCEEYSKLLHIVLREHECSHGSSLDIIYYTDEVQAGNPLANDNQRKIVVGYWALRQHGPQALSLERHWFPLGFARSVHVKRLAGGMSEYQKYALLNFYQPCDIRDGITLRFFGQTDRRVLFAKISIILGDELALKDLYSMKGAAGSFLCPLCRNLVDHKSGIADYDAENRLVTSCCLDFTKIEFASDESVRDVLKYLGEQKGNVSKTAWKHMQQYSGFNYVENGVLLCTELGLPAVSALMFDWMHTFLSGGVWNTECALLIEALKGCGMTQEDLYCELQEYTWPSAIASRGVSGKAVFRKAQSSEVKCSASEALSLYGPIRFIVHRRMQQGQLGAASLAINSYMRLSKVLDLLQGIKRGTTREPKHHYSVHMGRQFSHHKCLYACFTQERKHKEVKRFADMLTNTHSAYEQSVLVEALRCQLLELHGDPQDPLEGGLCGASDPTPGMVALLRSVFEAPSAKVQVSSTAFFSQGAKCSAKDVLLLNLQGEQCVGQCLFCAQVDSNLALVAYIWTPLGHNEFTAVCDRPVLCGLSCVVDTCVHSCRGDRMLVVPPVYAI